METETSVQDGLAKILVRNADGQTATVHVLDGVISSLVLLPTISDHMDSGLLDTAMGRVVELARLLRVLVAHNSELVAEFLETLHQFVRVRDTTDGIMMQRGGAELGKAVRQIGVKIVQSQEQTSRLSRLRTTMQGWTLLERNAASHLAKWYPGQSAVRYVDSEEKVRSLAEALVQRLEREERRGGRPSVPPQHLLGLDRGDRKRTPLSSEQIEYLKLYARSYVAQAHDEGEPAAATKLGRFTGGPRISSGSEGVVWMGFDRTGVANVAAKVLKRTAKVSLCTVREARIMKKIPPHPNVVSFYDMKRGANGDIVLYTEFVDGMDMHDAIKRGLHVGHVKDWMRQVLLGLSHIHSRKIVHKDIKPENIIVSRDLATVKIADFGVSATSLELSCMGSYSVFASGEEYGTYKRTGIYPPHLPLAALGSIPYMSPQARAWQHITEKTDIWSAGVLFAQLAFDVDVGVIGGMITTINQGDSVREMAKVYRSVIGIVKDAIQRSSGRGRQTAPAAVAELVLKMMRFHRSDRPSAEEALSDVVFQ